MSKNLTRKGLAFGAVVALGSSLFAGTPASAAELLTLAPSAGTTYNTLSTSTFTLATGFGTVGSNYSYLKYAVTNSSQATLRVDMTSGGVADSELTYQTGTSSSATGTTSATASYTITNSNDADVVAITLAAGEGANYAVGDYVTISGVDAGAVDPANGTYKLTVVSTDTISFVGGALVSGDQASANDVNGTVRHNSKVNDDAFVIAAADGVNSTSGVDNDGAIGVVNALAISTSAIAADTAITVQAWLDTDGNNVINDGESTSPVRTVTFKNVANLTGATSLVSPFIGDTSVAATVTLSGDINYQQITAGDVKVNFTGDSTSSATGNAAAVNVAWDSAKGDFRASTAYTVAAAELFRAQLYVDNDNGGAVVVGAPDLEGSASNATAAAAGTDYSVLIKAVNAAGVKNTADNTADGTTNNWLIDTVAIGDANGTGIVKTDGRKATISFFVGTDVAAPIGVSSVPVRAVVSSTDVELDDAVTVNGSSVYTGQSRTVNLTTSTGGLVTLEIAGASADNDETVVITTSVSGTAVGTYTITFKDSVYSASVLNNESVRSIKSADTYALTYKVVDQWGITPANNAYRVWVEDSENEGRTTAADFNYTGSVVDGVATVNVIDNGAGVGSYKAVASLATNGSTTAINTATTSIKVVADTTPSKVTLKTLTYGALQASDNDNDGDYTSTGDVDNTAKLIVETATLANFDARYAIPGATAPAVTAGNKVVIAGTVTNAGATAVAGTPVTVAAKGFLFLGASRYFTDSIVVYTGTDGTFSVDAWSNLGGAQTVSVTAGAATASQALTFAAATATAASHTVTAATSSVVPGRTVDIVVAVKDKYGNGASGISVTLASTGAGYLKDTTGTTDAAGNFTTKLISSVQDNGGSATVTATVAIAGVATSKTATVAVAVVEPAATITGGTAKISYTIANAKNELVIIKVAGKTVKRFTAYSDAHAFGVKAAKGSQAVKVYVAGELVAAKTVSVK